VAYDGVFGIAPNHFWAFSDKVHTRYRALQISQ